MSDLHVKLDTRELDISLLKLDRRMLNAIRRGFGETMSRVKSRTKDYINANFRNRATQKVGMSLDSEITLENDGVSAIFGSVGPDFGGEIGFGIHSDPDDSGGTWNLAQMYNDGISPGPFVWKGESGKGTAHIHGRQAGSEGGGSPWISKNPYFYGAPGLHFIDEGESIFNRLVKRTILKHINKEFNGVI